MIKYSKAATTTKIMHGHEKMKKKKKTVYLLFNVNKKIK